MDQPPILSVAASVFSDTPGENTIITENGEIELDRTHLAATDVDSPNESDIVFILNGIVQVDTISRDTVPTDVVQLVRDGKHTVTIGSQFTLADIRDPKSASMDTGSMKLIRTKDESFVGVVALNLTMCNAYAISSPPPLKLQQFLLRNPDDQFTIQTLIPDHPCKNFSISFAVGKVSLPPTFMTPTLISMNGDEILFINGDYVKIWPTYIEKSLITVRLKQDIPLVFGRLERLSNAGQWSLVTVDTVMRGDDFTTSTLPDGTRLQNSTRIRWNPSGLKYGEIRIEMETQYKPNDGSSADAVQTKGFTIAIYMSPATHAPRIKSPEKILTVYSRKQIVLTQSVIDVENVDDPRNLESISFVFSSSDAEYADFQVLKSGASDHASIWTTSSNITMADVCILKL